MRIATYNVEWFTNLFDDDGKLMRDDGWSGRRDVTRAQQIEALGRVFCAMDADAVMVIEAPDTSRRRNGIAALEGFAQAFDLRACRAITGFENDTQQEIALLYDPDALSPRHDPQGEDAGAEGSRDAPRFDGVFRLDLDIDASDEAIRWSKPPLELSVETASGASLRLIGVHAKSKAPHGARSKADAMRISIENRRKQLAQCLWLRQRVDRVLTGGEDLIVLGDFNDGPGLDEYEKLFGQSGVEIVLGPPDGAELRLFDPHAHAALHQKIGTPYSTSRFFLRHENRYMSALLDYIMASHDLLPRGPDWHIWHPFDDPACWDSADLRTALLTASDHFPVTLDIAL